MMMKTLINLRQHMDMYPLFFTVIWYQLLYCSTKVHLKVCWWITQLHKWASLMIIWMLHHVPKQWGEMVLTPFFCTLTNVSLSIKQNLLQQHLLMRHCWSNYIQGSVSRLLKISRHLLISKRLTRDFITSQENPKHCRKQIGLQFYLTIPQRVTIIHDYQIEFNENKDVFKYLNEVPPSDD